MESKVFFNSKNEAVAQITPLEPGFIFLKGSEGESDERAASEIAGYILHLFETEGLSGVLIDASGNGKLTQGAMDIYSKSDAFKFVKRIGIYGIHNSIVKLGVEAIIKASGRDNIRIFGTREESLAFIKDASPE